MKLCPIDATHKTTGYSLRQKLYCHDCRQYHPWPLKDGQQPLVNPSRADRRPQQ